MDKKHRISFIVAFIRLELIELFFIDINNVNDDGMIIFELFDWWLERREASFYITNPNVLSTLLKIR